MSLADSHAECPEQCRSLLLRAVSVAIPGPAAGTEGRLRPDGSYENGVPMSCESCVGSARGHSGTQARVKPGYLQSPGIPRNTRVRRRCRARPTPRAPVPTAARPACSSMRTVPCAAAIQVPEGGRGAAPGTACGADDAAVPTFIFKIEAVLGMSFCDPEQLIAKMRRNKLAAADKALLPHARQVQRGPA